MTKSRGGSCDLTHLSEDQRQHIYMTDYEGSPSASYTKSLLVPPNNTKGQC